MTKHKTGTREEMIAESKRLRQRQHVIAKELGELTEQRHIDLGYNQFLDRAPKEWKGGTIPTQRSDEYA